MKKIGINFDLIRDIDSKFMEINNLTAITESYENFDYSNLNIDSDVYTGNTKYESFLSAYYLDLYAYSNVVNLHIKNYLDLLRTKFEVYLIDDCESKYSHATQFFIGKFQLNIDGFFTKESALNNVEFFDVIYSKGNTPFNTIKIDKLDERSITTNN